MKKFSEIAVGTEFKHSGYLWEKIEYRSSLFPIKNPSNALCWDESKSKRFAPNDMVEPISEDTNTNKEAP